MIPGIRCRNCGHEVANAVWDNRESDKVFVHVGEVTEPLTGL
jgi:DNA-directed RNA polymerase subunit N (RpoN/RPB10)